MGFLDGVQKLKRAFANRVHSANIHKNAQKRQRTAKEAPQPRPVLIPGMTPFITPATPHRSLWLPVIHTIDGHPNRPVELQGKGRDFVYGLHTKDVKYAKFWQEHIKNNFGVPKGPNHLMDSLGLYSIEDGDMIWARDMDAPDMDEKNDVLQTFRVHSSELTPEIIERLNALRDRTLGPRDERTRSKIRLETFKRNKGLNGTRCYAMGLNTQKPRNVGGPSAAGKLHVDQSSDDEDLALRRKIIEETTTIGDTLSRVRLGEVYEIIDQSADLFNVPRIGCHANTMFSGGQNNYAVPQERTSTGTMEEMGIFGEQHFDKHDSVAGYSLMFVNSDLPDGYEGGRFHLVELGFYNLLDTVSVTGFSGLRWHGGTPPLAPEGVAKENIPQWAYRWVFILYPQRAILDGRATLNIAADTNHTVAQVTVQEKDVTENMQLTDKDEEDGDDEDDEDNTDEAVAVRPIVPLAEEQVLPSAEDEDMWAPEINFANDGRLIMEERDLRNFIVRSYYFKTLSGIKQLGPVDGSFEQFRQGFKWGNASAEAWKLAPDGTQWKDPGLTEDIGDLSTRQQVQQAFHLLCISHARFIPTQAVKYAKWLNPVPNKIQYIRPKNTKGMTSSAKRRKNSARSSKNVGLTSIRNSITEYSGKYKVVYQGKLAKKLQQRRPIPTASNPLSSRRTVFVEIPRIIRPLPTRRSVIEGTSDVRVLRSGTTSGASSSPISTRQSLSSPIAGRTISSLPTRVTGTPISGSSSTIQFPSPSTVSLLPGPSNSLSQEERVDAESTAMWQFAESRDEMPLSIEDEDDENFTTDIPFLRNFTVESIDRVSAVFSATTTSHSFQEISPDIIKLMTAWGVLEDAPWEPTSITTTIAAQSTMDRVLQQIDSLVAETLVLKDIVLNHHHLVRSWLLGALRAIDDPGKIPWLSRLVRHLKQQMRQHPKETITFNSTDYLPSLQPSVGALVSMPNNVPNSRTLDQKILESVLRIITTWLGLPAAHLLKCRFLGTLLDHFPSSILLLPEVWEAYSSLTLHLRRTNAKRPPLDNDFLKFRDGIIHHPRYQDGSFIDALDALALARDNYMQTNLQLKSKTATLSSNSIPPSIPYTFPPSSNQGAVLSTAAKNSFVDFLRQSWHAHKSTSSLLPSKAISNIQKRPDSFLAFRNHAPSRQAVTRIGGPFDSAHPLNQSKIFSLLIWRGILFNTPAARTSGHSLYFADLDSWSAFLTTPWDGKIQGEKFFCSNAAHGVTKGRATKCAQTYWDRRMEILELVRIYRADFDGLVKALVKTRLPAFGRLTSYLLVVDMVEAGIIVEPSVTTEASIVHWLQMGAASELQRLGCAANQVVEGFEELYLFVLSDVGLSVQEQRDMGFGIFTVEHGLCKRTLLLPGGETLKKGKRKKKTARQLKQQIDSDSDTDD